MARTIGLYGAGMIAMAHGGSARILGMPITAVASRTTDRAASTATQLGAQATDYADLPGAADIVVVSTPPQCHHRDAGAMLRAGAAVVLEKPLCTTLEQADELVEMSDARAHRLLYAENLAYSPSVQRFLALARTIGPLATIEVRTLQALPTWGAFTTWEWGGGALFDLGVHPLAIAVLLAAPAKVIAVQATLGGSEDHDSDEHADVTLTLSDGRTVHVVSSWRFGPDPVWDAQAASETDVVRLEFWPEPVIEHNGVVVDQPAPTSPVPVLEHGGYIGQLAAFERDLDAGDEPFMSARFGRGILDIVCAAYASAADGASIQPVPFTGRRDRTPLELWRGKRS